MDVLLLPFGLRPASPIFNPLLRRARDRDIVVVAPIGNGGSGSGVSPGRSDLVISVGALDERGAPARYSGSDVAPDGRCRFPHVLAPGQIDFVEAAGAEHTLEGTSFAAARVAGLAAGLRAAAPEWSASAVRSAIEHTATPITGPARSRFGAIEMGGALRSARESTTDPAPSPFPLEETSFRDPRLASLAKWSVDEIPALVRCANVTGPTALDATIAALTAAGIAHSRAESADTAGTVLTHIAARHVRRVLELDSLELVQCVDVSPFRH